MIISNISVIAPDVVYNFLIPLTPKSLVRMGVKKDGGYVVNEELINKSRTLVSFGMGNEFSFEKEFLVKDIRNKVFIYDFSINHFHYLKELLKNIRRILTKNGIPGTKWQINELIGVTPTTRTGANPYSQFVNLMEKKFNKGQYANYVKQLGKYQVELAPRFGPGQVLKV